MESPGPNLPLLKAVFLVLALSLPTAFADPSSQATGCTPSASPVMSGVAVIEDLLEADNGYGCPVSKSFDEAFKDAVRRVLPPASFQQYPDLSLSDSHDSETSYGRYPPTLVRDILSVPGFFVDCSDKQIPFARIREQKPYASCRCSSVLTPETTEMYCSQNKKPALFLSRHELDAISIWSDSGAYQNINGPLRSQEKGKICPILPLVVEIEKGLLRLPTYRGTVYRGSSLPGSVLDAHRPGKTVTYSGFTSTTTDPSTAHFFGDWFFVIHVSQSCHNIQSVTQGESEILCLPGTQFRVDSRDDTSHTITMTEVKRPES